MTRGYKWKMFLIELSYIYLLIPGYLMPFTDLFIILPLDYTVSAEMYFTLAADNYRIIDYIAMFFIFCFIGWVWEVGLHVVKDQMFVIDIICCNIFGPNIGEGIGKEYSARDNYRCAYAELPCPETDAGTQPYQP